MEELKKYDAKKNKAEVNETNHNVIRKNKNKTNNFVTEKKKNKSY